MEVRERSLLDKSSDGSLCVPVEEQRLSQCEKTPPEDQVGAGEYPTRRYVATGGCQDNADGKWEPIYYRTEGKCSPPSCIGRMGVGGDRILNNEPLPGRM